MAKVKKTSEEMVKELADVTFDVLALIGALERENNELRKENGKLKEEITKGKAERGKLQADNKRLLEGYDRLDKVNDSLAADLKKSRTEEKRKSHCAGAEAMAYAALLEYSRRRSVETVTVGELRENISRILKELV